MISNSHKHKRQNISFHWESKRVISNGIAIKKKLHRKITATKKEFIIVSCLAKYTNSQSFRFSLSGFQTDSAWERLSLKDLIKLRKSVMIIQEVHSTVFEKFWIEYRKWRHCKYSRRLNPLIFLQLSRFEEALIRLLTDFKTVSYLLAHLWWKVFFKHRFLPHIKNIN
jgi:hypothetical protein